ncbi:hypothetical protein AC579_5225 [Pseudocercospora musae]|uniref:Uncharacterized protein n=1 Tax=Pseudocercospora musae TaxID=113226 RepID=A0A139IDM0_9PEZI|nr:hypothetical protein AC579_5225 [Pseudocercospora musae]
MLSLPTMRPLMGVTGYTATEAETSVGPIVPSLMHSGKYNTFCRAHLIICSFIINQSQHNQNICTSAQSRTPTNSRYINVFDPQPRDPPSGFMLSHAPQPRGPPTGYTFTMASLARGAGGAEKPQPRDPPLGRRCYRVAQDPKKPRPRDPPSARH